jgi:uncharacterized membrane protein
MLGFRQGGIMPATIRELNEYRKRSAQRVSASFGTRNVSMPERLLSGVSGAALVTYGLSRRTAPSILLGLGGSILVYRAFSGYCPVYGALGISTAEEAGGGSAISVPYGRGVRVEHEVTIARPVEQVYRFWRNFENLPRFMRHLESVRNLDERRSHWITKGPAGKKVEWDAELINEIDNELIGWRSLPGSDVDHAGSVHFKEVPDGTVVRVILRYDPPAGKVGAAAAMVLGEDPQHQLVSDLTALQQMLEQEQPTA